MREYQADFGGGADRIRGAPEGLTQGYHSTVEGGEGERKVVLTP